MILRIGNIAPTVSVGAKTVDKPTHRKNADKSSDKKLKQDK